MLYKRVTKRIVLSLMLVYVSGVCIYTYDDGFTRENSTVFHGFMILTVACCFVYGVAAIYRDYTLFGIRWIIQSFDRAFGVSQLVKDLKKLKKRTDEGYNRK